MNYNSVKTKKKKNTAVVVVCLILALVIVGGALAGVGYHFGWFTGKQEVPTKKPVPMSTYNLNVSSIDDILGIEITENEFAYYMDENDFYEEALKDWKEEGSKADEKPEKYDGYFCYGYVVLNVDSFGVDYKAPKIGFYDITLKVNGKEYKFEKIVYDSALNDYNLMITSDFKGKLSDGNIFEGDIEGFAFALVKVPSFTEDDMYCLMFGYNSSDKDFESFEVVAFNYVGELSAESQVAE